MTGPTNTPSPNLINSQQQQQHQQQTTSTNNNHNQKTAIATAADEMVNQLQLAGFMSGREAAKSLLPQLRATSQQVLTSWMSDGKDPLDVLDPAQSTLGYLHILQARLHNNQHPAEIPHLIFYLTRFAEGLSLDQLPPGQSGALLNGLVITFLKLQQKATADNSYTVQSFLLSCLMSLKTITSQLSMAGVYLTFVGVQFLKTCILTRQYKYAWDMVIHDISEVEPKEHDIRIQDFLLHHYYGGMICIGLKKFDRALEMLSLCISAPASITSAIQIEAYRKFMLVSYIKHGKVLPIPKYTAQPVARATSSYSSQYHDFTAALESNNRQRVVIELTKNADLFSKHHNLGLAKQAVHAWTRKSIIQLTQTYLTLSLSDIARLVGIGEGSQAALDAEQHLLAMIEEGGICATISHHEGGMVSFHDHIDAFDDVGTTAKLDTAIRQANEATSQVSKMDRTVASSKEYLSKIVHGDRSSGGGITSSSTAGGRLDSLMLGGNVLLDDDFFDEMTR